MRRLLLLLATGFSFSLCTVSQATPRFYPNLCEFSPNQRFRFTAISPDNAHPLPRSFQNDFSYCLADVDLDQVVWQHSPQDEFQPTMAFVRNDGMVVLVDAVDVLKVFNSKGEMIGEINLLEDAVTDEENERYVHDTTAGPMWKGKSRWYFFNQERDCYFVIRPYWGRRIVIDLSSVDLIQQVNDQLQKALDDEEASYAETKLNSAIKDCLNAKNDELRDDIVADLGDVIQIAGQRKLRHLATTLRQLERYPQFNSSSIGVDDVRDGEICVTRYSYNPLRRLIQLSIRRMGEKPNGHAVTAFSPERTNRDLYWAERESEEKKHTTFATPPATRAHQAMKVKSGMSPIEILRLIGPPDYVRDKWEYDLDGDSPTTLIIHWNEQNRVQSFWQTRPALWELGLRDDE